jgi:ABC-2 type transport system ATP-binding protein
VIEVDEVGKSFTVRRRTGRLRRSRTLVDAVDRISFTVEAGEFVGYLGPNGAGKSTTIKMLTGILTPTSGRVRVAGLDPSRQRTALARRIGVVFGQRTTLWWDLPLRDSLTLVRHLYRVERSAHRARLAELTELLDLGAFLDTPVRQLSLGQRMRGDLAAALVHDPELLVLDEPTAAMDVETRRRFWTSMRQLAAAGRTVLFATHYLQEADGYADRIVLVRSGRIVADGPANEIKAQAGRRTIRATLSGLDGQRRALLAALPGVVSVEPRGEAVLLSCSDSDAALRALLACAPDARDIEVSGVGLEDAFLSLTTDTADADAEETPR